MPDEVLTDNGKQFTARFGKGGEVLFDSQQARAAAEDLLPLRLPATLQPADSQQATALSSSATPTPAESVQAVEAVQAVREDADTPPAPVVYHRGPVEFDRVVPASGNLAVRGKQFWLGPVRAGVTVTFWADCDVIHLSIAGARVKTVRSHLSTTDLAALATSGGRPAGPSPLPTAEPGAALEVDRTVSQGGLVSLGQSRLLAAGRRSGIRGGSIRIAG